MQKWAYLVFSIDEKGIRTLNGQDLRTSMMDNTRVSLLGEQYRKEKFVPLTLFLNSIGKQGWEVVTSMGDSFVAKKPIDE
jgi:hypothetical protein